VCDLETSRIGAPYVYDINNLRVKQTLSNIPHNKRNFIFHLSTLILFLH
jgi:hypothetical protein